jgi:hypothetical protein
MLVFASDAISICYFKKHVARLRPFRRSAALALQVVTRFRLGRAGVAADSGLSISLPLSLPLSQFSRLS